MTQTIVGKWKGYNISYDEIVEMNKNHKILEPLCNTDEYQEICINLENLWVKSNYKTQRDIISNFNNQKYSNNPDRIYTILNKIVENKLNIEKQKKSNLINCNLNELYILHKNLESSIVKLRQEHKELIDKRFNDFLVYNRNHELSIVILRQEHNKLFILNKILVVLLFSWCVFLYVF
jgi:hypothetical protein